MCDRTKLTTPCVESRQSAVTAPAFNLPHLHLAPPLGVTPSEFCRDFRRQKIRLHGPWGIVRCCLRDPMFSRFSTTPSCDKRTDGQTHDAANTCVSYSAARVKMSSISARRVLRSRANPRASTRSVNTPFFCLFDAGTQNKQELISR